jgi:glycosyltransferase involved in cell wall biosynthesis
MTVLHDPMSPDSAARAPLSVGVMVDLFQSPSAGGHVKCWERIAEAARGGEIDLTVYFLGTEPAVIPLAENVRYVHVEPVLNTRLFPFLDTIPAHTDLAPIHLRVLNRLRRHHLLHSTDAFFALARTASVLSRWSRRGLVASIHTDTPGYTRLYSKQILRRVFGDGFWGRTMRDRWRWHERLGASMQRRLDRYLHRCDWAMASDDTYLGAVEGSAPKGRFSRLRRGIDRDVFHPRHRDRARLESELGVPASSLVLLFVGRVDAGKDVVTLARAARILRDRGLPVHVVCAGEGTQTREIQELLGDRVTLLGNVPQQELSWLYASSDLFVFPSQIEIFPNVVLEAKASALPVVVSSAGGSARLVGHPGPAQREDGLVIESNDSFVWAEAIDSLLHDPARRGAMGEEARRTIERAWPSWRQVLHEDLLPVWQLVARERGVWA